MRIYDHMREAVWSTACTTANPIVHHGEQVGSVVSVRRVVRRERVEEGDEAGQPEDGFGATSVRTETGGRQADKVEEVTQAGRRIDGRQADKVEDTSQPKRVESDGQTASTTSGEQVERAESDGRVAGGGKTEQPTNTASGGSAGSAANTVSAQAGRQETSTASGDNYKWWVLVAAIFGVFVSILDATVVNTALPRIQAAFGTDLHQASYVATAYTLAQGVVIATSGYLANRYGVKRVYLTSLALFTIGSALCGIAWSMPVLIIFRVLQGAGGATLLPLSLTLVFGAFPPEQRGLANGVFGIPILAAPAFGPALGGYIAQYVDWRWIFYLNVPSGLIGVILGWRVLRESQIQKDLRFDWRGFLILAPGLALLLYGLSNLSYDGWSSILNVSGPTILALILLVLAVPLELRTKSPLLDLRLFTGRNFLVGNIIIWVATIGLFGATFLLPQYLQALRGLGPSASGLLLMPQGLAAIVGTIISGALYNRLGPRILVIIGAVAITIDTYLLSTLSNLDSSLTLFIPLLIVRGLALPLLTQTTNTLALNEISNRALAGANTVLNITRSVVSSLAVAVLINILQSQQLAHQAVLRAGGPVTHAVQQQAQALAYQDIYLLTAIVTIPLLFLPFLLREKPSTPTQPASNAAPSSVSAG